MPLILNPISTNGYDLISAATATNALAAGNFAESSYAASQLPLAITAASREIGRYCNRPFVAATYSEIVIPEGTRQDRGEPAAVKLSYFPVIAIGRCATNRATVIQIINTDTVDNEEASVQFAIAGDPELYQWAYTGLSLSWSSNGTASTSLISWPTASPFTTINSLAASINSIGSGWKATVQPSSSPNFGRLRANYLVGAREPKDASAPGLHLDAFTTTASNYDVDRTAGIVTFYRGNGGNGLGALGGQWGSGFGGGFDDGFGSYCGSTLGSPQYQVTYTAGFATIPADIQQVCCEVVRGMFDRLKMSTVMQSESQADSASWAARQEVLALPAWATQILDKYKDWKV